MIFFDNSYIYQRNNNYFNSIVLRFIKLKILKLNITSKNKYVYEKSNNK